MGRAGLWAGFWSLYTRPGLLLWVSQMAGQLLNVSLWQLLCTGCWVKDQWWYGDTRLVSRFGPINVPVNKYRSVYSSANNNSLFLLLRYWLTSTLLTQTTCWWFELAGNQEMTAWEQVTPLALTHVGPMLAVSRPMTMVQAASRDVRREAVTERTLMRCGFKKY